MNILEHYDVNKLKLSDPYNIDDDTFFCKFSYNNMPFVIKTNKICYLKKRQQNTNNYIYISLTSIFQNQNILLKTLKSIKEQTLKPNKCIIYLSEEPYLLDEGFKDKIINKDWLDQLPQEFR